MRLEGNEEITLTETIPMPGAELWSPESPFLYELETSTGGDSVSNRFGVREFRFETATKRAYLNGKIYFMRGSNITLHRFFDDPQCRALPWDESWLRKLLIEIPKRMHWNSFRFCIGPVPERWLDIADEAGLLIQNEYFIWSYHDEYDTKEVINQYKEWMHDNWNHPSVVIWDACNETHAEIIPNTIIPAVRTLDLSDRPWENSYNLPPGPNDPVEDHPYLFSAFSSGRSFSMVELEKMTGAKSLSSPHPSGHAVILNEYGWLWLRRDGIPTPVTKPVYDSLLGPDATPEERFELDAYLLAGLTEFWRAHRNCAGVLHFVYLSSGYPGVYTSDHFRDIEKLVLEPHFEDYVGEAFKPLGVYINFWHPRLDANSHHDFDVMMVNDLPKPSRGKLVLALESLEGKQAVATDAPFAIPSLGQMTYRLSLAIPKAPGKYLLKAAAHSETEGEGPTISRRKVSAE
ncbi:MAG: glycoside hydrolase family 2 TIM barrel-domain containing protein [Terriglobia bacterium]